MNQRNTDSKEKLSSLKQLIHVANKCDAFEEVAEMMGESYKLGLKHGLEIKRSIYEDKMLP